MSYNFKNERNHFFFEKATIAFSPKMMSLSFTIDVFLILKIILQKVKKRGFNGSVNISENCDFRSQYDLLNLKYVFVGI